MIGDFDIIGELVYLSKVNRGREIDLSKVNTVHTRSTVHDKPRDFGAVQMVSNTERITNLEEEVAKIWEESEATRQQNAL